MVITAIVLSVATTVAAMFANIYAIMPFYFLLAAVTSIASLKMQQWLVTTIDRKILASSVGLLNTILMATAPMMTTVLTTISGLGDIRYALFALLAIEIIILFVAAKLSVKTKVNKEEIKPAAVVNE